MPASLLSIVKNKKLAMSFQLGGYFYNHPHRLKSVSLSGGLDYTVDERSFSSNSSPSNGDVAYVFHFLLTFTGSEGASAYHRIFEERYPWVSVPSGSPDQGKFLISHRPGVYFWRFETYFGLHTDLEVIGSVTRATYTYAAGSWGLTTTDAPEALTLEFQFFLSAGGDPISGGRDDDSDDEKANVQVFPSILGTYASMLPSFGAYAIDRFPWDDSWTSETAAFADIFTAHLTAQNALDGSGHSGTCTISLDFG